MPQGILCIAMVAIDGDKIGTFFKHPHQTGSHPQFVFLFAGNLAGVTAHAVLLTKYQ
jgi:hypothetical protein